MTTSLCLLEQALGDDIGFTAPEGIEFTVLLSLSFPPSYDFVARQPCLFNQSSDLFDDFSQQITLNQPLYDHLVDIMQFYLRKLMVCTNLLNFQGAFVQSFDVDGQQMRWRSIVDNTLKLDDSEVFIAIG